MGLLAYRTLTSSIEKWVLWIGNIVQITGQPGIISESVGKEEAQPVSILLLTDIQVASRS